jgi:hypothetical protein
VFRYSPTAPVKAIPDRAAGACYGVVAVVEEEEIILAVLAAQE